MGDAPEVAIQVDDFLWPSPEMRQRAIDEAIKIIGVRIADTVQGRVEEAVKTALKAVSDQLLARTGEVQELLVKANEVIKSLQSVTNEDFVQKVRLINDRLDEIESQLLELKPNMVSGSGSFSDYPARMVLKNLQELIRDTVSYVKSHYAFNGINNNLHDYELKGKVLGDIIAEVAKIAVGKQFFKLEQISDTHISQ